MTTHLAPLALAANISQSARTRPDTVLLILGLLYHRFDTLKIVSEDDTQVKSAVCASIAKRWMDTDQDIFIPALILHPLFRCLPFSPTCPWTFSPNNIIGLMSRLYCRLFRRETPRELRQEVMDYLMKRNNYSSMPSNGDTDPEVRQFNSLFTHNTDLKFWFNWQLVNDPLNAWQCSLFSSAPADWPPLARLARRLFSICPNSASCERLFSLLKRILTPARTRLSGQNLQNIAELNIYIKAENRARGAGPRQRARHIIATSTSSMSTALEAVTAGTTSDSAPSTAAPATPSEPTAASANPLTTSTDHFNPSDEPNAELDSDGSGDTDLQAQNNFASIRDGLVQLSIQAGNDNGFSQYASATSAGSGVNEPLRIQITELFNFQDLSWLSAIENQGQRNLDEELQLYDLLSLDAPGDIDPDDILDY